MSKKNKALYSAISMALLSLVTPMSYAQDDVAIEEVFVTGVAKPTTKFESSMSVTSLSSDDISDYAPRSTAEVFRNIPGIQAESSSGDANVPKPCLASNRGLSSAETANSCASTCANPTTTNKINRNFFIIKFLL